MRIIQDNLSDKQIIDLLDIHLQGMTDNSPPGTCFALDLNALKTPDITFYSAWIGERAAGCVALKQLAPDWGKIKSMRAHPDFVGQGIGRALLEHIFTTSQQRKYAKISLETGTTPAFYPSIELYARNGFTLGEIYGDYRPSTFNIYMHKDI